MQLLHSHESRIDLMTRVFPLPFFLVLLEPSIRCYVWLRHLVLRTKMLGNSEVLSHILDVYLYFDKSSAFEALSNALKRTVVAARTLKVSLGPAARFHCVLLTQFYITANDASLFFTFNIPSHRR